MLDLILVHSLFVLALVYLGWRFFGRGAKPGCGSCPSCPAQARDPKRRDTVSLTVHAASRPAR